MVEVRNQAHRKSWFIVRYVGQVQIGSGRKSYRIRTRGATPREIFGISSEDKRRFHVGKFQQGVSFPDDMPFEWRMGKGDSS